MAIRCNVAIWARCSTPTPAVGTKMQYIVAPFVEERGLPLVLILIDSDTFESDQRDLRIPDPMSAAARGRMWIVSGGWAPSALIDEVILLPDGFSYPPLFACTSVASRAALPTPRDACAHRWLSTRGTVGRQSNDAPAQSPQRCNSAESRVVPRKTHIEQNGSLNEIRRRREQPSSLSHPHPQCAR